METDKNKEIISSKAVKIAKKFYATMEKFYSDLKILEIETELAFQNAKRECDKEHFHIIMRGIIATKSAIDDIDNEIESKYVVIKIITSRFTERESDIFKLVIKGHTAQYIADKLSLSKRTIENNLRNMLIKVCEDKTFCNLLKKSPEFDKFKNAKYKNDNKCDRTPLKSPIKLLKHLYNIVLSYQN